jgi:hypothetical protein
VVLDRDPRTEDAARVERAVKFLSAGGNPDI